MADPSGVRIHIESVRRPAVAGTLLQLGSSRRRRGQTARGPCKAEIVIADQDAAVVGELLAREGAAVIIPRAELERRDALVLQAQAALRRAEVRSGKHTTEHAEALMDADDAPVALLKGPR